MSITENNIDLTRIIKNVTNIDIDDRSLDLINPKRVIIDISTDSFIKTMFTEDSNYFLFLNYFNFLDFYLNYYINLQIVLCGEKPLIHEEDVTVYFKGGNVMNYHFTKMLSDPVIKEKFANFFKKSDFDFSISIHTHNENRFTIIKKHMYPRIIDFLSTSTSLFNNYFENIVNDINVERDFNESILDNFRIEFYDETFESLLDSVKYLLKYERVEIILEIVNEFFIIFQPKHKLNLLFESNNYEYTNYELNYLNKILKDYNFYIIGELKNKDNSLYNCYNNYYDKSMYHACLLYPYYKLFIESKEEHEEKYSNLINDLLIYNFNLLRKNKFYTKEKIKSMTDMISNSLHELDGYYYEINANNPPCPNEIIDPSAFIKYNIIKDITPIIIPYHRDDYITYNNVNNPNGFNIIEYLNNDNNIHYISINYTIKDILRNNVVLDFDLFRIKFNLITTNSVLKNNKLNNKFNIPSEFVDISIVAISSNQFYENKQKFIMPIILPNIKLPNITVKSHSYVYFINDLTRILFFTGGNFLPWTVQKFEKRLKRLILFVYLYDLNNNTTISEYTYNLVNLIKLKIVENTKSKYLDDLTKNIMLESYKEYTNIFDLVHIDQKYKLMNPFIKLLLVMVKLLDSNNATNIINYYRAQIKRIPLNNISMLRDDFIKFLNIIIDVYKDLNFN